MRAVLVIAAVGCGGGPSIDVSQPAAVIVTSNCDRIGSNMISAMVEIQVTLGIGQAVAPEVNFFSAPSDPNTVIDEFVGCGGWTPFGNDTCTRDVGQPPTVTVIKNYMHHTGTTMLPIPATISINVLPLDAPGSFSIGSGDSEEVNCN